MLGREQHSEVDLVCHHRVDHFQHPDGTNDILVDEKEESDTCDCFIFYDCGARLGFLRMFSIFTRLDSTSPSTASGVD